ncbi:MAG: hypothetical protein ACK5XN_01195 [Bacteroidota bacterium]|jgi:hypothetical protein
MIKFEELTLGEIEEVEMLLNDSIDRAFADGKPKGRAVRVLYWVAKKRNNPNYKFEDTERVTQAEALAYLTGDDSKKGS